MTAAFGALVLGAALLVGAPPAQAGVIATDEAAGAAQSQLERERVKALVERPEVARQLEKMGLPPRAAAARVDAMNDAEVRSLAGRLEALPAGGDLGNTDVLIVVLIVLLIVLIL